jgi:Tfp pilus assembly protein PilO
VQIDNLAKLNNKSRNAISAAIVIIVAVINYHWVVAPHVTHLSAVQQYASAVNDVIQKTKILSSAIAAKKKNLEQLRQQFGQLQGSLFMPDKAKEFFSDLQVISEQVGCTVYSLNYVQNKQRSEDGQLADTSGIVTQTAMLSVIGTYGDVVKLVERLQSREQKVWIDSIKMTTLEDNSSDQLRCDITITICTIQDKETIAHE